MTGANANRVRISETFKRLGWIAMVGLVLAAPAAQAAVFDIPDGLVEINPNDGQCSLVEAFENIGVQDQVHNDCPAPDPAGPNTVNLAPGSEYLLQTPAPESFGYLDSIQIPVEINGNNASILRPAGGEDTIVFDSMLDDVQAFSLNNLTLDGGDLQAPLIIHGGGALNLTSVTIRNTGTGIEAFVEIPISIGIASSRFENAGTGVEVFGIGTPGFDSGPTPVTVATTVFDQVQEGIRAVDTTAELDNNLFINGGTGVRLEGTLSSGVMVVNRFENQGLGVDLLNGTLNLSHSGFTGGGTGVRLPIGSNGTADIRNVTFSGQALGLETGGGSVFVNNATFANNSQAVTAFINGSPSVQVANSIFAGSAAVNCAGGGVVSLGHNLSSDTTCVSQPTDLSETDPLLGPLADNGGPTLTHALLSGSPAISASQNVDTPCEATDQRFVARPQDGNNDGNPQCDIGAFELEGNPQPSIELLKSITSGSPYTSANDVITYEFVATNTGNVTLENVVIDDPDVAIIECELTQPAVLEPSQSQFCNGSYVITQADVDAGSFTNTATVTGQDIFGTPVFDQDSATAIGPVPGPAIVLNKDIISGSPYSAAGDVITYSLVATNIGNVSLFNVTISDPDVDVANCTPAQGSSLDPAESMSCDGSYTVTQDDVDGGGFVNTATAFGTAPDESVVSDMDTAIADGLRDPDIALTKSITSGDPYAEAGDVITYLLLAVNTGNVTLTGVMISDPDLGALDCTPAQPAELAPGSNLDCTGSYTVTIADVIAGSFTNTATASGIGTDETVVVDMDSATATVAGNPEVTLDKSIVSGSPFDSAGDVIVYELVATNTGNVTLTGVMISDPDLGALSCTPAQPAIRQPGESLSCTGSYTVTQADVDAGSVTNTATARGLDPLNALITALASATADGPVAAPAIRMNKSITAGSPYTGPGDVIEYLLEMTNTGNVTLSDAVISDPGLDLLDCGVSSTIMAAESSPTAPSDARQTRQLRASRMSGSSRADSRQRLMRRSGAISGTAAESAPVSLAPASSFACTGQYTVTEADLNAGRYVNTATASALSPLGDLVSDQDSATAPGPLLLFPADPDLGTVEAGDPFAAEFSAVGGIPPYTFDLGPLPAGFTSSVSGETLTISGVTLRAGRFEIPVTLRDAGESPEQVIRTYFLQVEAELELAPESLPDAVQGTDYFQALTVINGIPPFRFLATDDLPPGLILADNVLLGTPGEAGDFEFSIIALDAQNNVGQADYTLTVLPPVFEASNLDLPDAVLNVSYSHQLFANSPANPVVWSDAQGLPPGLELQYTGFIAGTPTQAGSFQITARATNDDGQTIDANAPLVVLERGVINATPALPPGVAGRPYTGPLTIFGFDPPFDCTVASGALPDGLVLGECDSGITGIPGVPGSFGFELLVTDGATPPASDRGPFSIRIADPDALAEVPGLVGAPTVSVPVPDFGRGRPSADLPDESLQQMAIDGFGNRYLVGYSYNGNDYDLLVLKFDPDGKPLWSQRFDSGDHDFGYGIAVNPIDQGIYVAGYLLNGNRYEGVVLSFDAAGVLRWEQRVTGGVLADALYGVAADRDGVYVTGERYNGNNFDALYAGFSHQGVPRWIQLRTTAPTQTGYVVNADDCSLPPCPLLVGGSEGAALTDGWLLAVDRASGAVTSEQSISQAGILASARTSDGWVIGGDTAAGQWRITRITRDLQPVWSTTFADGERLRGMVTDEADFIYAAGRTGTGQNALLTLLTPEGQVIQSRPFDTGARDQFNGVGIGPEGLLTAAGERREPQGNRAILFYLDTGKGL